MKSVSADDAFREFAKWSKNSAVGFSFAKSDAHVNFYVRRASLEISGHNLLFEVKGTSMVMLHFDEQTTFSELTPQDIKTMFPSMSVMPGFKNCIGAKFPNGDFCFVFDE